MKPRNRIATVNQKISNQIELDVLLISFIGKRLKHNAALDLLQYRTSGRPWDIYDYMAHVSSLYSCFLWNNAIKSWNVFPYSILVGIFHIVW